MSEKRRAWTPERAMEHLSRLVAIAEELRGIRNNLKALVGSHDELVAVIAKALNPVENGKAEEVEE